MLTKSSPRRTAAKPKLLERLERDLKTLAPQSLHQQPKLIEKLIQVRLCSDTPMPKDNLGATYFVFTIYFAFLKSLLAIRLCSAVIVCLLDKLHFST